MLRKILLLTALGVVAMVLGIATAFVLWRKPTGPGPGPEKPPESAVEAPEPHGTAEATGHTPPAAEGAEVVPHGHADATGHSAPVEKGEAPAAPETSRSPLRSGPAFEVAQAALNSLSPEEGIKKLEAALALPHNPDQGALLHEAAGELYALFSPPDFVRAQAAFEQALALSGDTLLEEEIRYKAVQMLIQAGKDAEARQMAVAQFEMSPPTGPAGFKLKLLLGQLEERSGNPESAEKIYRSVLDAAGAPGKSFDREEAASLARLSALRLTQFLRGHGREQEIEEVTAWLKKLLGQLAPSAD